MGLWYDALRWQCHVFATSTILEYEKCVLEMVENTDGHSTADHIIP